MANSIFSEILNFMQNHSDGQAVVEQSKLPAADVHKVAQEVVPKISEQVQKNPQTLSDLFKIISQNKEDPQSLLNSKPGFDPQQAKNEGSQILQAIFGSGEQTAKVADDVSQKTGLSVVDISSILPMIATMVTKALSGKAASLDSEASSGNQQNMVNELLGFLDVDKDGSVTSNDLGRIGQQIMSNLFSQGESKNKDA